VVCVGDASSQGSDHSFSQLLLQPRGNTSFQGEAENGLITKANQHSGKFELYIMRPAGVIPESPKLAQLIAGNVIPSVSVMDLAAFCVQVALKGNEQQTFENTEIARNGRAALQGVQY
jgi:hypothetical protein